MKGLDESIGEAQERGHVTLAEIRGWVARAVGQTSLLRNGETYYPAYWVYGSRVGDASTSDRNDTGLQRASEHVAHELDLDMEGEFNDITRGRDAASMIAAKLRKQAAEDAIEDAHIQEPIALRRAEEVGR